MSTLPMEATPFTFTVFGLAEGKKILLGSGAGLREGRHVADAAVAEGRATGAWVMEELPNHHVAYRVGEVPTELLPQP